MESQPQQSQAPIQKVEQQLAYVAYVGSQAESHPEPVQVAQISPEIERFHQRPA